jgi:hypothetical protein
LRELFFDPAIIKIPSLPCADGPEWCGNRAIEPVRMWPRREKYALRPCIANGI